MVLPNVTTALAAARLPATTVGIPRDLIPLPQQHHRGARLGRLGERPLPQQASLQRGRLRYRPSAPVQPSLIAPRRKTRAIVPDTATACDPEIANVKTMLGIRQGEQQLSDRYAFISLLRFAGESAFSHFIGEDDAAGWLARFRNIAPARAANALVDIRKTMRKVFFDQDAHARQGHWDRLPQTMRHNTNLMIAISDAASAARVADQDPLDSCDDEEQRENRIYRAVATALQGTSNNILSLSETPYRMALTQFLREHDAPHHAYFSDRLEVLPSNVRRFINDISDIAATDGADTLHPPDALYTERRSRDLEAMLYQLWCGEPCEASALYPSKLEDMRAAFDKALETEHIDSLWLSAMFVRRQQPIGKSQAASNSVYHNGLSMCNAAGCDIDALAARLDRQLPNFSGLSLVAKQRLIKRKLYQLKENPDYPIGHPFQSMATVLMRLSNQPQANRYVRYSTPLVLEQAWEACNQQWIKAREFPLAPELMAALHSAGASGLVVSGLNWYRDIWENTIVAPLADHPVVRAANASDRKALWQWLQRQAPGWQPDGKPWASMPPRQYADTVTAFAKLLDHLQHSKFPVYHPSDSWIGIGYQRFDPMLRGLPSDMGLALTDVAMRFDTDHLRQERVFAEDWITTASRLLQRMGNARTQALEQRGLQVIPGLLRSVSQASRPIQDPIPQLADALPDIGLLPQIRLAMQKDHDRHESDYAMMLVRDAGAAMALGSALDAAAPDTFQQIAALCRGPAGPAIGTRLLRAPSTTVVKANAPSDPRADPLESPLNASPGSAQPGCAAALPVDRDIANFWEKLSIEEQSGPYYRLSQMQVTNAKLRSAMAANGPPEQDGPAGGFLDLADIDACTQCNGQALGRRATVLDASDWLLKTGDGKARNIERLLSRHVTVTITPQALQAWEANPDARYEPLGILRRLYRNSEQCRKLLNWHDDHTTAGQKIAIVVEESTELRYAQALARVEAANGSLIVLPCDARILPTVMGERHFPRQTIAQVTIEGLVKAITCLPAPAHSADERGVNIWLANRILLQDGEPFWPRVNAAVYTDGDPIQFSHIDEARHAAEMEDQYMERLGIAAPISHDATYQGSTLAERPTVAAVIDLLTQLDYRRVLREAQSNDVISSPTPAAMPIPVPARILEEGHSAAYRLFHARFAARFMLDFGARAPTQINHNSAIRFLFDCHRGSTLFRRLFDRSQPPGARQWTIFPHGYPDRQQHANHRLVPVPGVIDTGIDNRLYQGLFDSRPAFTATGAATEVPARALLPLNLYRRLLDGVVAVLSGDTGATDAAAHKHRGATVWLSDTILWQRGWPVNRRLAAALLSANATAQLAHLKALSGTNRRAARAEDRYILQWLDK